MKFLSTRGKAPSLAFSEALRAGLAPDGGLYVPERFPDFSSEKIKAELPLSELALPELAEEILAPFLAGDPLECELSEICRDAFNFVIPARLLDENTSVLELFHGPTAAFKDVGARFLSECVKRIPTAPGDSRPRTVIVATSGDTGGAVAAAFFRKPGIEVFVLYPQGKISPRQEKQLTAWGGNVRAFAIKGDFDDCQRLVKEAFLDPQWQKTRDLISANSINIGRILPQTVYYAAAALACRKKTGENPGFVIPSGNLGNALAALWAKRMGFPIRSVALALNANRAILEYFQTGQWKPAPTVTTLANAMDVGNASNVERLRHLYPDLAELKRDVQAFCVSDEEIRESIRNAERKWKTVLCPHTATAAFVRTKLGPGHWILVATAHPAKFDTVVEPIVGKPIAVPPELAALLSRKSQFTVIAPTLKSLTEKISK